MTDAILVVNAGSSSVKFSVFSGGGGDLGSGDLPLIVGGQVGGIGVEPAFVAKDGGGKTVGEKRWGAGAGLTHEGALAHVVDWVKERYGDDRRLAAVGHRVTHGGADFVAPVRVDKAI